MVELQASKERFAEAGLGVVAISYDSRETLAEFAGDKGITFPLLADPGSETIRAYGIYNDEASHPKVRGVPHPGTFVVGKDGEVKAKLFFDGYKKRHDTDEILAAFSRLP